MAVPFSEEALRALQDSIPVYETVLPKYATESTHRRLLPPLPASLGTKYWDLAKVLLSGYSVARLPPLCH